MSPANYHLLVRIVHLRVDDGGRDGAFEALDDAEFTDLGLSSGPEEVTVRRARPPDASFPDLPERFAAAVAERTGRRVTVSVEYVERARSDAG
ncbi:hypothetical protein [Candidatus Halobonum tyrrellensis]|nr:hypothetical protein [Candidatus Halobonum tyrrellensis]